MYKAILFARDGDWVTDFRERTTKDEVLNELANMGSRWIFYPVQGIIIDRGKLTTQEQVVNNLCEPFDFLNGKRIKTIKKWFLNNPETVKELLENY